MLRCKSICSGVHSAGWTLNPCPKRITSVTAGNAAAPARSWLYSGSILASAATYGQVSKLFESGHFGGALE